MYWIFEFSIKNFTPCVLLMNWMGRYMGRANFLNLFWIDPIDMYVFIHGYILCFLLHYIGALSISSCTCFVTQHLVRKVFVRITTKILKLPLVPRRPIKVPQEQMRSDEFILNTILKPTLNAINLFVYVWTMRLTVGRSLCVPRHCTNS